jgi:hypothetical protein
MEGITITNGRQSPTKVSRTLQYQYVPTDCILVFTLFSVGLYSEIDKVKYALPTPSPKSKMQKKPQLI